MHLVRSSLRYSSKKHWGRICAELREIYTAPTAAAARARFDVGAEVLAQRLEGALVDLDGGVHEVAVGQELVDR